MRAISIILGLGLLSLPAFACSSVPDVVYADADASAADTGTRDTGTSNEPDTYSCPDNPPPQGRGVCCGTRLCLNCTINHCSWCERGDCESPDVCCGRSGSGGSGGGGPNGIDCRLPSAC